LDSNGVSGIYATPFGLVEFELEGTFSNCSNFGAVGSKDGMWQVVYTYKDVGLNLVPHTVPASTHDDQRDLLVATRDSPNIIVQEPLLPAAMTCSNERCGGSERYGF
jgi:hypothetical protein